MTRWLAKALLPLTLLLAAAVVAVVVWLRGREDGAARQPDRVGFQAADNPPELSRSGRLDPRFALLGAWQRAAVPVVSGCVAPTASGARDAVAGEEVRAVADGLVVFAGREEGRDGAVVVLDHRGADGAGFQSVYPGLDKPAIARGWLVARGTRLGRAGAGGCAVVVRAADEAHPGPAPAGATVRVTWLAADDPAALAPSALAVALRPVIDPWSILQADTPRAAERLLEILGGEEQQE